MRKSKASNSKQGGIATVLIVLILLFAAGGVGYYFFTKSNEETYAADTLRLATATSQAISQLDERSSHKDLQRIRGQITQYRNRKDADPTATDIWNKKATEVETILTQRDALADQWQKRATEFDPDCTLAELEAFDAELKTFTQPLDQSTRNRLLVAWSQHKNQIMADMQSVSAVIIAKTFPSGAKTYLDGEYIGLSSLGIQNVRKGKHQLTFKKDGYLNATLEVVVTKSEKIEPPAIDLQLAVHPIQVSVVGGKKRAKVSISIEKTADDNDDIILYIDEQTGRDATFTEAPLGRLRISITADSRLVAEQLIDNRAGLDTPIQLDIDQ